VGTRIQIIEAAPDDAPELAAIHIAARRDAMPYLPALHTNEETVGWFVTRLAEAPDAFWVARDEQEIVGYLALYDVHLDDLYVRPRSQGRGVGSALLEKAKSLSPRRIALAAFRKNVRARAFYETRGFRELGSTDGENEERLPDVQYEWGGP
jgi:ribosomal protein S18 acetylase RimI-like enzyme